MGGISFVTNNMRSVFEGRYAGLQVYQHNNVHIRRLDVRMIVIVTVEPSDE
jgi:hypothetical protein